jgi:hypothetical protein
VGALTIMSGIAWGIGMVGVHSAGKNTGQGIGKVLRGLISLGHLMGGFVMKAGLFMLLILLVYLTMLVTPSTIYASASGGFGGMGFIDTDGHMHWKTGLTLGGRYNPTAVDALSGGTQPSIMTTHVEYLQDIATLAGADFKLADWEGPALSVGAQGILRGSTDEM